MVKFTRAKRTRKYSGIPFRKVGNYAINELPLYGDSSIQTLIGQFGRDLPAKSLAGTKFEKATIFSLENVSSAPFKNPKEGISMQLKELLTNDMLIAFLPSLHKLATICLSIPISTESAERCFSDMKLIKNCICNSLAELSLSNLNCH